jgi:hypothetical protein
MSRRDVAATAQLPRALQWFWEVFGHSALSQRCAPPDDPGAREAALDMLRDWATCATTSSPRASPTATT